MQDNRFRRCQALEKANTMTKWNPNMGASRRRSRRRSFYAIGVPPTSTLSLGSRLNSIKQGDRGRSFGTTIQFISSCSFGRPLCRIYHCVFRVQDKRFSSFLAAAPAEPMPNPWLCRCFLNLWMRALEERVVFCLVSRSRVLHARPTQLRSHLEADAEPVHAAQILP